MQQIAMSWLVYRLTGSVFLLGAVGFADKIPTFLITPFAGVFLDRYDRRRVVILTQILLLIQALALGILTWMGLIAVWHILALSVLLGVINAFDIPARQSFVLEMIEEKSDLSNAIALNSSLFNGARLIGPSIGGILIGLTSESVCFFLNAVSYLAAVFALLAMKMPPNGIGQERKNLMKEFREGFAYAFGFPPVRTILLLLALVSLMGMPYIVLMPVFATDILRGGPHTLGFLMSATGAGALIGALYLASRKSVVGLGRWIAIASALFAAGVIAFSFSRVVWISFILLVFTGFGMMVHIASSNTILQTIVEDEMRGRAMSFYVASITGMAPFGSLLSGSLASRLGAPVTLRIGGLCCLLGSAVFALRLSSLRSIVRPIYAQKGILPEVSPVDSAIELTARIETLEE